MYKLLCVVIGWGQYVGLVTVLAVMQTNGQGTPSNSFQFRYTRRASLYSINLSDDYKGGN